jgi:hypothetical protein
MRRLSFVLALIASIALVATVSAAANQQFRTFGTGDVTEGPDGTFTIVNDPGEFGGVFLASRSQSGKLLADVDFSFDSSGAVAGGAPRLSIPINDERVTEDLFAFLDVNNCGSNTVSTESPNCQVHPNQTYAPAANWDAFAAEHPTFRIVSGGIPFIISDQPGTYIVSNIVLR